MKKDVKFSTRMGVHRPGGHQGIGETLRNVHERLCDSLLSGKAGCGRRGLKEVLKELKSIGRNLNQLVTLAHMGRVTVIDLEAYVGRSLNSVVPFG